MSKKAFIAKISGRVQQVGFRMWTAREAKRLGIIGWVRNTPDGCVEACLVGTSELLDQMLDRLYQGPPLARVDAVERKDIDLPDLGSFTILE